MQRLDRTYIVVGFCWLVAGMAFGVWLGATNHVNYANSHAHINLLGFTLSVVFGLLFKNYPEMARSKLALWQFATYEVGIILLIAGKILIDGGRESLFLVVGSLLTIIGAGLMLYLFARHGHAAAN
jgi:hypothetical protein